MSGGAVVEPAVQRSEEPTGSWVAGCGASSGRGGSKCRGGLPVPWRARYIWSVVQVVQDPRLEAVDGRGDRASRGRGGFERYEGHTAAWSTSTAWSGRHRQVRARTRESILLF